MSVGIGGVAFTPVASTAFLDIFEALAAPFSNGEVKLLEHTDKNGKVVRRMHYITARTLMNRLDDVLGPECWWDDYTPMENSVVCRLTIRLPNGETITKCDAGGYAGMADSGDDDKSGFSDAFKRAGVKFGVARYLYRDGVASLRRPAFNVVHADGTTTPADAPTDDPPTPGTPPESTGLDEDGERERRLQDSAENEAEQSDPEPEWEPIYATLRKEVERANSGWMADHPDGPEAIMWEEVAIHLAHVAGTRKLHTFPVDQLSADHAVDVIAEIDTKKNVHKFLLQHLYHYIGEALKVATERAKPKRTRGRK